jgi:hypothetical protein
MEQSLSWEPHNHSVKFPAFYESERSLQCQQKPATGPYPVQDASSPLLTVFP